MLAVRGDKAQLKRVLSLRGPVSIWSNRQLEYFLDESRPLIGADRVGTELGHTGEGVGVAVIDSGVDGTHPDVSFDNPNDPADDGENNEMVQNVKILGDGFFTGTTVSAEDVENTDTTSGHGTHVAGTVGGSGEASDGDYTGVAPGADLVGIGAGDTLFILYALEGFDYAISHQDEYNIKVINNSWGTSGAFEENDPVNVASREAHDRGITVAFAAGNEGPGNDTMNPYAAAPWVIGVAAGEKDGQTLADFSSRGRPGSNLYHPDLTAPGVDVVSARALTSIFPPEPSQPRYTTLSGTSMATPHVAGTVALLLDADPNLAPDQILDTLTATVDPMPGYQRHEAGAGYLNAFDAVSAVAPQPAAAEGGR